MTRQGIKPSATKTVDSNTGYDIDLIAGYDFGMLRLEAELGMKRANLDEFNVNDSFIAALNADLNRPSAAPDLGAPGLPALLATDFDLDGKVKVNSLMVNALFDFGNEDGLSFYAGAGLGGANVKLAGEGDTAWAMQLIAGARYALSQSLDIGLKYRYFSTSNVDLIDEPLALAGNSNRVNVGTATAPVLIDQVTNAVVMTLPRRRLRHRPARTDRSSWRPISPGAAAGRGSAATGGRARTRLGIA